MATQTLTHEQRLQRINELRSQVLLALNDDFLRLPMTSADATLSTDALLAQQQYGAAIDPAAASFYSFVPPNTRGRLVVKVVEAKLVKNYGIMRMDPYARLRIGNAVFETHTSSGKEPKWSRTVHAYLPIGVESLFIQIFDERTFTNDELVAWAHAPLNPAIFAGEKVNEWIGLSGASGPNEEGAINLVFSFTPVEQTTPSNTQQQQQQQPTQSTAAAETEYQAQVASTPEDVEAREAALTEICELVPNVDRDVVASIYEAKRGDKNETVNALLEMN